MTLTQNVFLDTDVLTYYSFPSLSSETLKTLTLKQFRVYHLVLETCMRQRARKVRLTLDDLEKKAGVFRKI